MFSNSKLVEVNSSWLFRILKDDAVKVLHSICQEIWKTQPLTGVLDCKRSVFIPIPKKGNAPNIQTTTQLHSSHTLAEERESKRRLFLERKVMTNLDNILKSRHYFANKGPSSQGYGFSSSRVWMWVGPKRRLSAEELMPSNCGAGEDSGESLGLQGEQTSQS